MVKRYFLFCRQVNWNSHKETGESDPHEPANSSA